MYALGLKALKRLVVDGDSFQYFKAKLTPDLFRGDIELAAFKKVHTHFLKFTAMPTLDTFCELVPEAKGVEAPELAAYYISHLENRFMYETINQTNLKTQELLKNHQDAGQQAFDMYREAVQSIARQQHRTKILNMADSKDLLLGTYHGILKSPHPPAFFGWQYMDKMTSGVLPGDLVSYVGRPMLGKSWFMLYGAIHNWRSRGLKVLFVSMEMNTLAVAQRVSTMYAKTNISQLKAKGYSSKVYSIYLDAMGKMIEEPTQFYIVDGNLSVSAEELYLLAMQLKVDAIWFDGAYLLRHENKRLNRYDRAAENCELMKRTTSELDMPTFASWQFARMKKEKKKPGEVAEDPTLEDIGYTDVVGQASSIVLGLMQSDKDVEGLIRKKITVMKGRNGEVGQFEVNWLFDTMNFDQAMEAGSPSELMEID